MITSMQRTPWVKRHPYAVAALVMLVAVVLRTALVPWLGTHLPYVTFLPAVALVAWLAGARAAFAAVVASTSLAFVFFARPLGGVAALGSWESAGALVEVVASGAIVLLIVGSRRQLARTRRAASRARREVRRRRLVERRLRTFTRLLERRVAHRTRALSEANVRLLELERVKREFLAVMTHELRTPLNAILGFSDLVTTGAAGPLGKEQKTYLDYIHAAGVRLQEMIDAILTASNLEAGYETPTREPVRLDWVVIDQMRQIRGEAEGKGLTIREEIRPVPEVVADGRQVHLVLRNLLSNAVKFTATGWIRVATEVSDSEVRVRVADSGPGVPPEEVERVFEPFFQVDATLRRRHEGAGLGLYLSRRLARLMGGDVRLHSLHPTGCELVLALPRVAVPAAPQGVPADLVHNHR